MSNSPLRVVVLLSGSGSNLQALLDDEQGYEIVAVVSDRPDAYGLQRGLQAGVATLCVPLRRAKDKAERDGWERTTAAVITAFDPDLLVMAGWMRVMSPWFIARFAPHIINQHPALLPPDDGPTVTLADGRTIPAIRGAHAVRDALRLGLGVTGCTIHRVTATVDVGPILAQREVPILPGDDETTLHARIKQSEHPLILQVVRAVASERAT